MVERYNTYYGSIACRSTGREICADGEHVSATDYAALEKQRDYLKMKVENAEKVGVTWTHIYEGEEMAGYPGAEEHGEQLSAIRADRDELRRRLDRIKRETDFVEYVYSEGLARKIRDIAEGRNNG